MRRRAQAQQALAGAVLGGILLTGGCHPPATRPAARPDPALAVTLDLGRSPPRSLDPVGFTVQVRDRQGRPVQSARVTIALSMPSMSMPENRVALTERQPGMYLGTGRFTMPGAWEATVTVARGTHRGVQPFPIAVE